MSESDNQLILGLMSGTSLDGVDLALCEFTEHTEKNAFNLIMAETIPYPYYIKEKLEDALHLSTQDLHELDQELGLFFAKLVKSVLNKGYNPCLIASHGHTVLHQPNKGITLQIGDGDVMAQSTRIPVVNDFRIQDVSKGGQGAPLVPIGDRDLFGDYDFCLNLGGIANVSFDLDGRRIACDISPCNMALNTITSWINIPFDNDGEIASQGNVNTDLLKRLNAIEYYNEAPPKSLGKEWFLRKFLPEIKITRLTIEDALSTVSGHISDQIAGFINLYSSQQSKILVTGGGAHNTFLISQLKNKCIGNLFIPNENLVDFKEAIIFAYLGYLRKNNKINVLASVTGAKSDTSAGIIHNPN